VPLFERREAYWVEGQTVQHSPPVKEGVLGEEHIRPAS
jgi:hypothetical protein